MTISRAAAESPEFFRVFTSPASVHPPARPRPIPPACPATAPAGPPLRDGSGQARAAGGADRGGSARAAPRVSAFPGQPTRLGPPRHRPALGHNTTHAAGGGAKARGPRPGTRLPAAAGLPARAGTGGQPRGGGGWTATARTSWAGWARGQPRRRGRRGAREELLRPPPPPLPREPPGPQASRAALMNGTRRLQRRRPSGARAPPQSRGAALHRPLPAFQRVPLPNAPTSLPTPCAAGLGPPPLLCKLQLQRYFSKNKVCSGLHGNPEARHVERRSQLPNKNKCY